ncbi:ABC transporter permease (plasmid) [Pseudoalteromonas sp. T1lg65]|uniref:ABC transporter permease n=1 Tax=Pseudoalteromonas sp. T1lg65 TaxID=2077101 RepID=UPI003F7A5FA2
MQDAPLQLKTLLKHKIGPLLLILQIAITFTILTNSAFVHSVKKQETLRPTGLDEDNVLFMSSNNYLVPDENLPERVEQDIHWLKQQPEFVASAQISGAPLSHHGYYKYIFTEPAKKGIEAGTNLFYGNETMVSALGAELVAGEDFVEADVNIVVPSEQTVPSQTIITKALAEKISPDNWRDAVGKFIYFDDSPVQIKGIINKMQGYFTNWRNNEHSALLPTVIAITTVEYVVRVTPETKEKAKQKLLSHFNGTGDRVVVELQDLAEIKKQGYVPQTSVSNTLLIVIASVAFITTMGIMGQANYSVGQRHKQIGIRRALGATKGNIIANFMFENACISLIGIVLGIATCIVLNYQLMHSFSLPKLPVDYLVLGAAFSLLLGQLSVIYPALKAASIPPAIATRGN